VKVNDVDLEIVKDLLESLPQDADVTSINFTDDNYTVTCVASYKDKSEEYYNNALKALAKMIKNLD